MAQNTNLISGSAMMVLAGVVLLVGPWFGADNLATKFILSVIGACLILLGGYFSRG